MSVEGGLDTNILRQGTALSAPTTSCIGFIALPMRGALAQYLKE